MKTGKLSRDELSRLAKKLGKKKLPVKGMGAPARAGARPKPTSDRHPLSPAQRRIWFLEQLSPGTSAYNVPTALDLHGALDLRALSGALSEIVERHAPLHSRFETEADEPVQVLLPRTRRERQGRMATVDLTALAERRAAAERDRLTSVCADQPFALEQSSAPRFTLLRVAPTSHRLVSVFHHIVSDGWSLGIFLRELGATYTAFHEGRPSPLPPLATTYAELVAWQHERLTSPAQEKRIAYWRERLGRLPAVLPLPVDHPEPIDGNGLAESIRFSWSPELADSVRAFCNDRGASLFNGLLAAFLVLLGRAASSDTPIVGAPIANRQHQDAEALIGMFVNTLPLDADLSDDPSFADLLERVRGSVLEAFDQSVPFERLVEVLQPDRDLSHPPIVQVLFGLQNTPVSGLSLPGVETTLVPVDTGTAKLDLSLLMGERDGRIEGELQYSTARIDRTTMVRFLGHFERLVRGVIADPAVPVSRIGLLSAAERHQALGEWNDTDTPVGGDPTRATAAGGWEAVHRRFFRLADEAPDAVALLHGAQALTAGELARRARRLTRRLAAQGLPRGAVVALCFERSAELVTAALATLEAGAHYVPIDPSYPEERRAFMLEDSGATVLLSPDDRAAAWAGTVPVLVCRGAAASATVQALGEGHERDATAAASPPPTDPEEPAYIIYTSGSTGRPKGAVLSHRGLASLVSWHHTSYSLGRGDRSGMVAGPGFDASVWETWTSLTSGGALVICDRELAAAPERVTAWLAAQRVTVCFLPTPLAEAVLEEPGPLAAGETPPLRFLLAGGDALHRRPDPGHAFTLINIYGPTECTVASTTWAVEPAPRATDGRGGSTPGQSALPPIGRPIDNLRVYVLDRSMGPVPIGVAGELYIAGAGVSHGYLARPGLTAERFVPNPFAGADDGTAGAAPGGPRGGQRLYRSGDLVRRRTDGVLDFLGRIDHQVQVRGFRIELGEIEERLADDPRVGLTVVVARGEAPAGIRLDGYVAATADRPLTADERATLESDLRARLADELPEYMVPSTLTVLDALPLTANGKVDRRALPDPSDAALAALGGKDRFEPPKTPTEEAIADIWRELLGVERVGRNDDFFQLGGHSLVATRLVSRLRRSLGVDLPLKRLFEAPTLRALGAAIDASPRTEAPPLERAGRDRPGRDLPLSFAQERLWFVDRMHPGRSWYNLPAAVRMVGALDLPAMARSLQEIVRRHEALRTSFPDGDGPAPFQVVTPAVPFPMPVVDLSALPEALRERTAQAVLEFESLRPFDLSRAPLVRSLLVRLDAHRDHGEGVDARHLLEVTMHHIVSDGWSMGVFLHEVPALYGAFVEGRPSPLPELPIQYPDFAVWQRLWLSGQTLERRLDYWHRHLDGAPELLELPTDRPRPPIQSQRGAYVDARLPAPQTRTLYGLAREEGATLFMALLAAFDALLHRSTGADDLVVGTPVAGRSRPEVEGLIGFFVNTLPLRTRVHGEESFRDLLRRVRDETLDAFEHQDVPFEKVVERLDIRRDPSRSPVFQVFLVLQNAPMKRHELPGIAFEPVPVGGRTAKFDLTLVFVERPDGALAGSLEFNRDLFDPTTARRLTERLGTLLAGALADPEAPISRLPLLGAAERQQLVEWNDTARPARRATISSLVAAQAERTPDAVAVVAGDTALTYGGLLDRAAALARHLRTLGAGPEVLVGVLAERSTEMMVGLLATLCSGAAYVPLEPTYPVERLRFMAADAGLRILLVQQGFEHLASSLRSDGGADRSATPRIVPLTPGKTPGANGTDRLREPGETRPPVEGRLAYTIYTSGSTGRPKGAMNSHAGPVNRLLWMVDHYGIDAGERFLQKTPFGFDVSVWELFVPLVCGARLEMARPGGHRDPGYLATLIAERGITTAHAVPSMLRELLEVPGVEACAASLRRVVASGEALTPDLVARFYDRLGALPESGPGREQGSGPDLLDLYGPTETAIEVTHWRCPVPAPHDTAAPIPIGRPVDNASVQVADAQLTAVPVGVVGELLLGGLPVGRGYLGRPGLTAERFVPDPFSDAPGARVYRSGDLARWRSDGVIEFLGRIDHQVKVRGVRMELGEIESALGELDGVRQAVVLTMPAGSSRSAADASSDLQLVAFVLPEGAADGGAALDVEALRRALVRRLPEAMVPTGFVIVPSLPLLSSGKVDRKALAASADPRDWRLGSAAEHVPPRTVVESEIAAVWRELLAPDAPAEAPGGDGQPAFRIGVHDDFFRLGGHSLLVTRLVARLRERLGTDLPVRTVFEASTLGALAAAVEAAPRAQLPPLRPIDRDRPDRELPLSFAQERLWFVDRMDPGRSWYNVPAALRLVGSLDVPAMARSLAEIVRRHEALRTSFREGDGATPIQVVAPADRGPRPPVVDLSALPEAARERTARAVIQVEGLRPFDLSHAPLMRSLLVRLSTLGGDTRHLLVVTMHHIVSDGWSIGVFLREVAALYAAFSQGRPALLPELPVQYPDFAVWQRLWLSGETLERRLDYWHRHLDGAPELLELPTDRPRPPIQSQRGAYVDARLPAAQADALRELARNENSTLFMALLTAFDALLHRSTGADDLVVGTPVAGRSRPEVEGLIGFFVNTLPLRTHVNGQESFRDLLRRVRGETLDAFEHQDVPFEKVVERLDIRRDPSRSPVYQVVMALQNTPMGRHELPGISFEPIPIQADMAKFDLTLVFVERPDGGLAGSLEFNRDLFDPTTARRLTDRLRTLLAGALANPEAPVARLPLLGDGERHQVLTEWNDTAAPVDSGAGWEPVQRRFARLAAAAPDSVAIADGGRTVTAGELARRARRLTARLAERLGSRPEARSVPPGTLVALCFERSVELVVAVLAALDAGATYLPIDPSYPEDRRAFMLEDSGAAILVAPDATAAGWAGAVPVLTFPGDDDGTAGEDGPEDSQSTAPSREVDPEQPAYIIYTSGSTGRPKGTVMAHRGLTNLTIWHRTAYELGPGDCTGMVAGPGFDASVWEIWASLTAGARLAIGDRPTILSPERLSTFLVAQRVSVCFLATPMAEALLEEPGALAVPKPGAARTRREGELPALRALLAGGDALHRRPEPGRSFTLINHYGPTECTVISTCSPVEPFRPSPGATTPAPPPIGRPIPNLRTYVLDRALEMAPIGVAGELHMAGIGLSHGYLGRPALTAERFVPDPFARPDSPGGRLYRSGDLVRLRTDGEIDFLGRIDHQVQVRGFRIELGEIEECLAADSRVAAAVVMPRGKPPAGIRLDGYVVPAAGRALTPDERASLASALRASLAKELPEYMVPSTLTVLEALPLTANGKLDRRALPDPSEAALAAAGGEHPFEPPRTPTEEAVAALWCSLLGTQRVDRNDDFFQLGGHSLLATRFVSRLRRTLGVDLPLKRLFETPTVAGVAAGVDAIRGTEGDGATTVLAPPIRPRERPEHIPLSFAQERLWFLDRFEPGSAAYNIPAAFRLRGALDLPTLTAALSDIVRRHEALRTTFRAGSDGAYQVIHPPFVLEPELVDLQDRSGDGRRPDTSEIEALARQEAERPFDLETGPLVRATLLRLAPDEHVFFLTFHHIVADGWAAGLFVRELAALYTAHQEGRPAEAVLPPLPIQYPDFALWQREWLSGDELERQLSYWRQRLAGAPEVLELPTDRPRPSVITPQGRRHPLSFDGALTGRLRALARTEGTTLYAVLLAAFDALLFRLSGQDDLVVGSPIANRTREEVEGLIGMFVNTLALRVSVEGNPSFRSLLGRVHRSSTEAFAHQDLPFEKLVAELQPERSRSHSPIFQVMLSVHDAGMNRHELPGLELEPVEIRGATAKFDLTLAVTETPDGLRGILGYRQALFDATTVERIAERLDGLLRTVAAEPDRAVGSLPLLTATEAHQVVVAFNETPAMPAEDRPIHHLVAERAAEAPDAVALVLGEDRLTYGALVRRARRLARRLRALGAGPGRRVAVCLERSFDQIVAVVAALEAGAAYLPLDLGFPGERLAFMVADAAPVALVTRSEHRALFDTLEPKERPREVLLDDPRALEGEDPAGPADLSGPDPEDGAYVIYTSGSTGRPKGVLVTHRSLAERLAAIRELFAFGPGDTQLQFASLSFDLSCDEVFLTLTSGATMVLEPRPATLRPLELMDECALRRATKISLTSSHWHQIVDELVAADRTVPDCLRTLCTGAEAPSTEKFAELARRAPAARLYNFYGPTEATISGTRLPLPRDPEAIAALGRVPIGRPFRGVRVYLTDPALRTVPVGVAGEILLGGSGVAVGYLGRPALTAERFVPDPWSTTPGARLYRTGDLARHRFDGAIEFLGRADTQVKVRGFRIELGEVEEALREHPDVREAAVMVRSETGDERLVAYLVPEPGTAAATLTVSALRAALAERLPEFMVPSAFVTLDAMPSTPTGKLDKKALPAPDSARPDLAGAYIPPKTPLERFLAEAWQDVLGVDRAGLDDSFFDLGGNSIQGATLINRLEATLGQHVYVTALFDTRNLGELATYLAVQYDERVSELFGEESLPPEALDAMRRRRESTRRVDDERLGQLRALIEPLAPFPRESAEKNPRAVFVLSPPRSGSTLLRVMLAGHPSLFAPPELELLPFNTLGDRKRAFSDRYSFWLEGVLRAVMELRGCDADEARAMMEERERREQPVRDFYREMQGWIGDRILVDKTPSYALDPAILERAEEDFDEPLYLHLLRHPYGGILSFEEARLEQLFFRYDHDFERRELAELIWTASHQNIVSFLDGVPAERQMRVHFEQMVGDPEPVMRGVAAFLGLDYQPAMIEPYQERQRRMTDGIHEQAKMLGDVKFHTHKKIDSSAAERWRDVYTEDFLGDVTRELAIGLGYDELERTGPADAAGASATSGLPPCLTALRPGDADVPPLFLIHAVFGDTYFFRFLAAGLAPGRPVYGLRALGMEAGEEPLRSIEAMAARYVDSIRSIRPEGPYHLVGSSMGGVIAYEMARRLRAAGQEVALLGFLDTGAPGEAPTPDDASAGKRFEMEALHHLLGGADPDSVARLETMESRDERLSHILTTARAAGALPASFDLARLRRLMDIVNANGRAMTEYRPEPYDGELLHVRAATTAERMERPQESGWSALAGHVTVEIAPGDHMSIHFPPHAEGLARRLEEEMLRSETAHRQGPESRERAAASTDRTG